MEAQNPLKFAAWIVQGGMKEKQNQFTSKETLNSEESDKKVWRTIW